MGVRSETFLIWLGEALATYRYVVYLGGLGVIVLPRILRILIDISLPLRTRRILIGSALGVMLITYFAERRFAGGKQPEVSETPDTQSAGYSLFARLSLAGAAVGVAIGIYVGFAMERPLIGSLFIFGAYLFVRMGYRHEDQARGKT